ncbi:hypothetical protein N2152v2_006974 [Parachlorella kessleri]
MAVDVTAEYWGTVLGSAKAQGADEDKIKKLRSAQLLRSLAAKTDFTRAAVEVANNILALRQYLKENQRDYAQQGKLRETERDRIEEEVGAYVRGCSANIDKLQQMLAAAPTTPGSPGQPAAARTAAAAASAAAAGANEDVQAHRQGMVLILSERLKALTGAFDRLRSLRYQQLQQQEAARLRRQPQRLPPSLAAIQRQQRKQQPGSPRHPGTDVGHEGRNGREQEPAAGQKAQTMGEFHKLLASQQPQQKQASAGGKLPGQLQAPPGAAALGDATPPPLLQQGQRQQQVQLDPENKALELELISMSEQVTHAERTVREIATLNQMFSTAIMHQSEQIEKLYCQASKQHVAVDASHNIGAGNVQLRKAIKVNSGTKKYLLVFLLVASLGLLLFDWWSS